ncbi:MAG: inositol monophosphatase family protein [Acidimicrobiia bacterium]
MIDPVSPSDLDVAVDAARTGAAIVYAAFGSIVGTRFKSDANPVTDVDNQAEEAIIALLRRLRPRDAILAEESGGAGWDEGRVWIVDPLDGTVNFIHGIPHVSVSVALWIDGRPSVGVIEDVTRHEEFIAQTGLGSTIEADPIEVSKEQRLKQSIIATGFPYDHNLHGEAYAENLGKVLTRVQGIRRLGSAALDLAWVACGRYEGYWEFGIRPWDTGAGVLLITEAGGTVTNHLGKPYRLDDAGLVVSNGSIHADLLAAVGLSIPGHFS